ncbi:protein LSM12 A [Biomphalaria glabrata]|uniref:Protein LSM12 homolog A-like n=1 Tax=Biomphalaria glabrata TaxID=6526 RepID=A0A9U8EIY0_BIOGL|nr:protein LSM12 homolog A-like [Biomphalaria glabrata]KAI8755592.1 protein LSM12-like protein A-like [Biomphalaria glabrata]
MSLENGEFFSIGSVIKIVDCHQDTYKGAVRSFDYATKILSIETPSREVAQLSDIYIFNLDYVANIEILEDKQTPEPLPYINVSKISQKLSEQEQNRLKQKKFIGKNVSPEGQRLMNTISKTINDCRWDGPNIVVLGDVTIKPPYGPRDLYCAEGCKALAHISKIVEKHHEEEAKRGTPSQR